jgi:hypothetical protein
MQKLCDYRSKLAYKAVCVVFAYLHSLDPDIDDYDDFAPLADKVLNTDPSHGFIFKGMENIVKVSRKLEFEGKTNIKH